MFELYSEAARRSIFFARYEATKKGQEAIRPHHILLGVLRESKRAREIFGLESHVEAIRAEIIAAEPPSPPVDKDIPLDDAGKHVLAHAAEAFKQMGHDSVQPEHLFLAVLQEPESLAFKVLATRGINFDEVRQKVTAIPSEPPPEAVGRRLPFPAWRWPNQLVGVRRWLFLAAVLLAFAAGLFLATVFWLTQGM